MALRMRLLRGGHELGSFTPQLFEKGLGACKDDGALGLDGWSARELKLRAPNVAEFEAWIAALRPFVANFAEDGDESVRLSTFDDDGDDDDSD